MANDLNKAFLICRLGKDPETKTLPNGDTVCSFSVATGESWKDKSGNKQERTTWHNIVIYRKLAEIAGKYLKKGSRIHLEGKIQNREYEKDGQKRYISEIICSDFQMLDSKSDGSGSGSGSSNGGGGGGGYLPPTSDESDIPF
jgi:single-strand DNA-binding protein